MRWKVPVNRFLATVVTVVTLLASGAAQGPLPAFEAASIRPSDPAAQGRSVRRQPGGRLTTSNMPLRELVLFAYQLQDFQLEGLPSWASTDGYDIVAKADGDPAPVAPGSGPDPLMLMMRSLLAERFKLTAHAEIKEMPIYALVRVRPDRLGPELEPASVDCQALMQASMAAARGGAPPTPPPPDAKGRPTCGIRGTFGSLSGGGFPLSQLANTLAGRVRRTVVDRTGLSGAWAFDLKFTPDAGQIPQGALPAGQELPAVDPNGPSIFTALQEQLGLRLDSTRGPVEMLVVDRVERPTLD